MAKPFDRDARVLGGKIGGHAVVAKYGGDALAARARAGLLKKLEQQVDPFGELPLEERKKRAESARLGHLARARKVLQDKLKVRRQERLEAAQRIYKATRKAAGLPLLDVADDEAVRCG